MGQRRLVTFHAPMARELSMQLITAVQEALRDTGTNVWLTPDHLPDIVIMGDVEGDGHERAQGD